MDSGLLRLTLSVKVTGRKRVNNEQANTKGDSQKRAGDGERGTGPGGRYTVLVWASLNRDIDVWRG